MKKNSIILTLSVGILALLFVVLRQQHQIGSTQRPQDTVQTTSEQRGRQQGEERRKYERAIQQLQSRLDATRIELEAIRAKQEASTGDTHADSKNTTEPPENTSVTFGEFMKSPEGQQTMRVLHEASIERTHRDLFDYMEFSDEELQAFKGLLIGKEVDHRALGMEYARLPIDERLAFAKRFQELDEDYDEAIRTFLNSEEDFDVYKQFEDSNPERHVVSLFNQSIGADHQLDSDQMHNLIVELHGQRAEDFFPTEAYKDQTFWPPVLTEEMVSMHMAQLTKLHEKYIASARGLLSESQMENFANNLNQERARQALAIRSAMEMFPTPQN